MSESEQIKDMLSLIGLIGFPISSIIVVIGISKVFCFFSSAVSKEIEEIDTNKGSAGISHFSDNNNYTTSRTYNYLSEDSSQKTIKTETSAIKKHNVETFEQSFKKAQEFKPEQPEIIEKKKPSYRKYDELRLIEMAKNDAVKGNYQVLYSQSKKNQEFYNNFYKNFRKDHLENMAKKDALMIHKHDIQKKMEKLYPEGQTLSIPAEIHIYQNFFVKEMSILKDKHERMLEDKQNELRKLYKAEASAYIDQEKFYQSF